MQSIKPLQQKIRNLFGVSTTEANAFIILLPTMLILLVFIPFYHHLFPNTNLDHRIDKERINQLAAELRKNEKELHDSSHASKRHISSIDPNNASFQEFITIGLDTIIAARILSYRKSGGNFRYKEDLLKIYDLNESTYKRIERLVLLPEKKISSKVVSTKSNPGKDKNNKKITSKPAIKLNSKPKNFDINKVDTLTLQAIRGIGPVLSSRIIRFRSLLGGFHDTTQYKEVYGLKAEVLRQLYKLAVIDENFEPQKISINTSDVKTLASHPYINWKIAKAIVAYRKQHGNFRSLEDLQEIKILHNETFKIIVPYLTL